MIGSEIGGYQIIKLIGQGGMGAVYEALQKKIGRRVALKLLLPEYANNPTVIERFFNEARAVNAISHPGIVQVSDLGSTDDGGAYLVMEYLEGETLSSRATRQGRRLPEEDAVRIGWQIASTLAAAHAKGIVHRDIKPANVMVVPDPAGPGGERVKVLDFGIAKLASAAGQTKAGQIMGTVLYMSPEQIRKPAEVDGQSDVYSLGAVLYALLAGRPPFVAKNNDLLVLTMHISHPPDPIEQVVPGLSPSLAALVMRMLHKSPTDRPTMPAVAEQLLAMDAGAGAHAGRRISRTALPVLTAQPGLTSHSASGAGTAPSQPSGSGLGGHSDAGLGSKAGPADGLTVSTLAQGAGQRLQGGTRAGGGLRRAVPLLALAAVAIGGVVVVSAVRSSSPAGPATSREEPRGSPTSKPLPRTTDPAPMTNSPLGRDGSAAADGKTGSAGTKPAKPRPADGKAAAADKLRKKNAAPTGKTTPLIR